MVSQQMHAEDEKCMLTESLTAAGANCEQTQRELDVATNIIQVCNSAPHAKGLTLFSTDPLGFHCPTSLCMCITSFDC